MNYSPLHDWHFAAINSLFLVKLLRTYRCVPYRKLTFARNREVFTHKLSFFLSFTHVLCFFGGMWSIIFTLFRSGNIKEREWECVCERERVKWKNTMRPIFSSCRISCVAAIFQWKWRTDLLCENVKIGGFQSKWKKF